MFTVRKKISVEYAHQLKDSYTTLCHETIHGHSGIIELFLSCEDLDHTGMVIDFGHISDTIKKSILAKYDHALFMPKTMDKEYLDMIAKYNKRLTITDENPTCENFAKMIYEEVTEELRKLDCSIIVRKVIFHETDTGYAEYTEFDL